MVISHIDMGYLVTLPTSSSHVTHLLLSSALSDDAAGSRYEPAAHTHADDAVAPTVVVVVPIGHVPHKLVLATSLL